MPTYTIEAEDLGEIGDDLREFGIVGQAAPEWDPMLGVLEQLLEGVRESHERTDGGGNQQSTVAEYAGLDDEYDPREIGKLLDVLSYFDLVDQRDRRYRLGERGEQFFE